MNDEVKIERIRQMSLTARCVSLTVAVTLLACVVVVCATVLADRCLSITTP
jgi:hypothetical protein